MSLQRPGVHGIELGKAEPGFMQMSARLFCYTAGMTPELIAIITTNVVLAGLIIGLYIDLKQAIRGQTASLHNHIDGLSDSLTQRGRNLEGIRESLSRLEGLIEGLIERSNRPGPGMR